MEKAQKRVCPYCGGINNTGIDGLCELTCNQDEVAERWVKAHAYSPTISINTVKPRDTLNDIISGLRWGSLNPTEAHDRILNLGRWKDHTPVNNVEVFEKHFRKGMTNKDFNKFKQDYPTLLQCILNAMDEVNK